jgi:hypothetical protein
VLSKVSHGLDHADYALWLALKASLFDIVATSTVPVSVFQTGDVEAFGTGWDDSDSYPGFTALRGVARQLGVSWFDVYGNHDAWFGTIPLPGTSLREHTRNSLTRLSQVPGLDFPWQRFWSPPLQTAHPDVELEVLRVNTVSTRLVPALLARGRVLRHPPPARPTTADTEACLADLRAAGARSSTLKVIRIAMMHHPPHPFDTSGLRGRLRASSVGALAGRAGLARVLNDTDVSLLLAGHRHALDPAMNLHGRKPRQPPLSPNVLQLVADSPTLAGPSPSFAVYELTVDENADRLYVSRYVHRHRPGITTDFKRSDNPDLSHELRLLG